MSTSGIRIVSQSLALVPGPLRFEEPLYSTVVQEIELYSPEEATAAALAFPGTEVTVPPEPHWWNWRAKWSSGDRFIELEMTIFETDPEAWGGFGLKVDCEPRDLLALWEVVQSRMPASWIHDWDCRIYTPHSFLREYVTRDLVKKGDLIWNRT